MCFEELSAEIMECIIWVAITSGINKFRFKQESIIVFNSSILKEFSTSTSSVVHCYLITSLSSVVLKSPHKGARFCQLLLYSAETDLA